ncbi:ABC transporter permease/substrate-binding protein [Sphingomonas sp. H39-1-10]|uniref:ABC transporter permease/substrate-binding protein n=1 Tax=Sphingomonas pollutisoli TaxID=3030829 RepID=UPI0023B9A81A|nr:ABC transporter permease/substrate-binding protein [Sphingomonas pollutisoli]MDF0486814.1 ABC transporter permease/substrate-binding protein [Sphingomonas pollutisoli]
MTAFLDAMGRVPPLLAQHLVLAMSALLLGIVISLPLAIVSARRPGVARFALGLASLIQTIPTLALLALFYPLLLSLSALVGGGIPALGFLPSLLALTLYGLLPILRNAVTGLTGLDPAVIEAADGVGMTAWQKLRLVEAPLVAPVVMAGIRTAAVWTIGAATLSTTVGQASLGDMIFAGLQTQNWALVLAGCFSAAALALAVDALLGVVEHGIAARRRGRVWGALAALAIGAAIALAPMWPGGEARVVVGAKGFSEQYILARVIGHRLEAAGYRVAYREGLGSGIALGAVSSGDIDVYVDYTGTIWADTMKRTDVPPRGAIFAGVRDWAARTRGVTLLGGLGFENAYAFAMRGDDAARRGVKTIADLVPIAPKLRLATDIEFLDRPEWAAVKRAYGLAFGSARPYQPTFMYRALESGAADVIPAFSSDGRIAADRLTVLGDPKGAIPGYDAILLLSPGHARDARFRAVLKPLIGRIPVEAMREANYLVDRDTDKKSPDQAARWLEKRVGL